MFLKIVFVFLILLLVVSSGRALHMGVFKAHRENTTFLKRTIGGIVSYALSAIVWLAMYSHHYMGW